MQSSLARVVLRAHRPLLATSRTTLVPGATYIPSRLYSASLSPPTTCPSCGAPLPTRLPACPKCFHIERPGNKYDFYELLNAPKSPNPFIVDEGQLKDSFRHAQRFVHPDLWATHGENKTGVARDLSGLVNEAYNTLLRPLSRIHYILAQHDIGVSETDQLDDPQLIMEVIEMREALEEAASESEVESIRDDVAGKTSDTFANIERSVQLEDWDEARKEAVRLKYLLGIEAAARSWPDAPSSDH
ncbi:hypothetical protein BC834DRAFT_28123 [Gloeopeniophorella convolvens]|nr:hypothetical protein BC834DRAFT_28123 [Gloeopeniophorella convolvens]